MNKKILSLLLSFVLLLSMALPVRGTESEEPEEIPVVELNISTAEEFLAFAENCRLDTYSKHTVVTLKNDIDLSGIDFESVPIFSGVFEGEGHKISGLSITKDGSVQGLFRYLTEEAVVRNLTIIGQIHPAGSRGEIGALAGQNAGTVENCSFSGSLSGGDRVGGLVGLNAVTGIIDNCSAEGQIYGDHFVGGIAGENFGVIRSCANYARINTTPQENTVELSDINLDSVTDTETANTVTDIGGISGISSGVIRDCKNFADIGYQHMGYNIGGIAGTQSGYIVKCENRGNVQGRKEIGGIVGQMEPASLIEYSEDTLQILRGQLGTMSGLVNQASGNAQANAGQITGQIGVLQDQAETARDAVEILIPEVGNPAPDPDAILAAQNTLSDTLNSMPGTLSTIASAAQATVSGLTHDLSAISAQINAMGETLDEASENLGGSVTDISDQDTDETLSGKVEDCFNHGAVLGDLNVGGIAGAMAVENDLDVWNDWDIHGEESMNFQSQVRAVVLDCDNYGSITGKKQNAGGIAGWQSLGLIKLSTNTGLLDCADADFVGGISGLSSGYIRSSFVKCEIHAKTYAGGVAGSGRITTDCLAQVSIVGAREKYGAILGYAEESEEENPIAANYYLCVAEDPGAVDGISYSTLAEPMALDVFMDQKGLPGIFQSVKVRFVFPDGWVRELSVEPGGSLDPKWIPAVPEKAGYSGRWKGLEFGQLENILFDMSFETEYLPCSSVIESETTRSDGRPLLLLEGIFAENAYVDVIRLDAAYAAEEKETLLESWQITAAPGAVSARFLIPEGMTSEELKIMIRQENDDWQKAACSQNGSYLVFSFDCEEAELALVRIPKSNLTWIIAGICGGVAGLSVLTLILRKKRTRKEMSLEDTQSGEEIATINK